MQSDIEIIFKCSVWIDGRVSMPDFEISVVVMETLTQAGAMWEGKNASMVWISVFATKESV